MVVLKSIIWFKDTLYLLITAGEGSRRHVSAREYYCFKLQIRDGQFNVFFHAGRLFQQFVVDMYVKVESMHLDWYAKPTHQAIICVDLYQVSSI
jgi:hypothetical protein